MAGAPAALLGHVGFYSYSIYLWHVDLAQTPIRKALQWLGPLDAPRAIVWLVATLAYVLLAVISGLLLSRLLEIPSLALRDRLFPSSIKPALKPSGSLSDGVSGVPTALAAPPAAAPARNLGVS